MPIKIFESDTVELAQSNLIEASAGTGKTYSIAILSLRLILESNIPIQEILMVTFTKSAVAELETRIRSFVRLAHKVSVGVKIDDKLIEKIVDKSILDRGVEETEFRLKNALLFLDETAILTIHSFCQRTLSEFSFETNQIFGADAMSENELKEITNDEVNQFWRNEVVVLERRLLYFLRQAYLTPEGLLEIIENALSGKQFVTIAPFDPAILSLANQQIEISELNILDDNINAAKEAALQYVVDNLDDLLVAVEKNKNAVARFKHLFVDPALLLQAIIELEGKAVYINTIFASVYELLAPAHIAAESKKQRLNLFLNKFYQFAIAIICKEIEVRKEKSSLLDFDDMIKKLHCAVVVEKNQSLIKALQSKYKAVFIDEFQDTDKLQYEIFNTLFGSSTILFYIGDPKQSIYGWRKADINTYFKAANTVANQYGMNTNYRSNTGIISAQNNFFKPNDTFDTFLFGGSANAIQYTKVAAPIDNKIGKLVYNGQDVTPITIYEHKNKGEILASVVATVIDLLSNPDNVIIENSVTRLVKPTDIGILVRSNHEGKAIKEMLAHFKIPAITIDDTKLSETIEAKEILFVLQAVYEISASNINKAILSGLTGLGIQDVETINEELVLSQFKSYEQAWKKEGVYVMLMKFITDYRVKSHLLNTDTNSGTRRLSNLLQLLELLHKMQANRQYGPSELINWLQKAIEGQANDGDEFQQRIESDEEAVKIVTIHKSKGLEYNIVIAPFLDINAEIKSMASFRDDGSGDYLFGNSATLTDEQRGAILTQLEQENRRLIYVAITRSKYKCYINSNTYHSNKNSSLRPFITALKSEQPEGVAFQSEPTVDFSFRYSSGQQQFPVEFKKADNFNLSQRNWHKISYTYLNPEHSLLPKLASGETGDEYNEFIFRKLKKGAFTGNLLHYIFEFISFSESSQWPKVIANALKRLAPGSQDNYTEKLLELLQHLTETPLSIGGQTFTLAEVNQAVRLNEFEFDFVVQPFQAAQISALSSTEYPLKVKTFDAMEGIMNGKMDLFFEKNGKYYILDWKSNWLGDTLADYNTERVGEAMNDNNYHLQYHIYTLAVYKYLSLRLPNFNYERDFGGVIYLFVRGVRKDGDTGIFYNKVSLDVLEKLAHVLSKK